MVDNGSTDGTANRARRLGVQAVEERTPGVCAACQRGTLRPWWATVVPPLYRATTSDSPRAATRPARCAGYVAGPGGLGRGQRGVTTSSRRMEQGLAHTLVVAYGF